jgi:tetratricopeptide (TPR) repeat protein
MNQAPDEASEPKESLEPRSAASFYEDGLRHHAAGRHLDARLCCLRALAHDGAHADALHLMGVLSLGEKQYEQAEAWLSRAVGHDPKAQYLTSLGTALLLQQRHHEAVQVFDKAVQLKPDDADLWKNLGLALVEAGRPSEAILTFRQALELNPRHWDAAHRAALLLYQAERYDETLACLNACHELQPQHFSTVYMRADALQKLKRFDEALADHLRAHALDPGSADVCYSIGNVLRLLHRHQEAIDWYDRSIALRPDFTAAFGNKAVTLAEAGRFEQAAATYGQAIAANPEDAAAKWNLALLQLLRGDFAAGWTGQEARWDVASTSSSQYPRFTQPKWLGTEPVADKTVLAFANEGFGDVIQFVRYLPMLAARGARVILVVPAPLCSLLSAIEGITQCLPTTARELPDCDFHAPLSSLPLAFGTRLDTIPAQKCYLPRSPAERVRAWDARFGAHEKLRVGLVWSGNPNHNNDRNRSLPLRLFTRLLDLDAQFVSLQKDPRPDDLAQLREHPEIVDPAPDIADFTDTAALIACLDLVIAVDTSVAHLAAALGCATWILLPYLPDWRWLLDRDDSPWYPTARLFRQTETRDYADVIARVRSELEARIAQWPA